MKRIIVALIILLSCSAGVFATVPQALINELTNELSQVISNTIYPISTEMAKHMGYYTGDGNVCPADTSGDLSIKFGLGGGVNLAQVFFDMFKGTNIFTNSTPNSMDDIYTSLDSAFAAVPFPYDDGYFKLGIPGMPMDVGLRLGVIPLTKIPLGTGSTITFQEFHIGGEARYVLFDFMNLLKIDGRLSVDYDGGDIEYAATNSDVASTNGSQIGTNNYNMDFNYQWGGVSIGTKVIAGLNIPYFSPFAGVGFNLNFGRVTTSMTLNDTLVVDGGGNYSLPPLVGSAPQNYNLFDMRLIAGVKIFIINFAAEYGVINQDWDFTAQFSFAF